MGRRPYRVRGSIASRSLGGSYAIAQTASLTAAQEVARRALKGASYFEAVVAWIETGVGAVVPPDEPSVFYREGFEPPANAWPDRTREMIPRGAS